MNIMQKYVLYDAGEKMPRLQIWTGVKKLWMKNIDAEQSEAWKNVG